MLTRGYGAKEEALAQEWYGQGESELKANRPETAVEDIRTALVYHRSNTLYQLRLAQALLALNRAEEARSYLLSLWAKEPEDGQVNLELGRLAMRQENLTEGLRYFHDAIYGYWPDDSEERRQAARFELIDLLLARGATNQAQAELVALAGDLPPQSPLHTRLGSLFLKTQSFDRALAQFQQALEFHRNQGPALEGAGEAAFEMGNYRLAERYLVQAVRENSQKATAQALLETARLVNTIDPFEPRLPEAERAQRTVKAFNQALKRLQACARSRAEDLANLEPPSDLKTSYARAQKMRRQVQKRVLGRNPDLVMSAMDLVFEMEAVATETCGAPSGLDLAIVLVGRRREGA